MKRVITHPQFVEQLTPHTAGVRYADMMRELACYRFERRQQVGMERLGLDLPAFDANGVHAPLQVYRSHVHFGFADTPAGVVRDLKLDAHPFRPCTSGKLVSNRFGLFIRNLRLFPARHCLDPQLGAWVGNAVVAPEGFVHDQSERAKIIAGRVLVHALDLLRAIRAPLQILLTVGVGQLRRVINAVASQEQRNCVPTNQVGFQRRLRIGAVLTYPRLNPAGECGLGWRVRQQPFIGLFLNQHPIGRTPSLPTVGTLLGGLTPDARDSAVLDVQKRASRDSQQTGHNDSLRLSHECAGIVKFVGVPVIHNPKETV